MSDQALLFSIRFSYEGIILVKGQLDHSLMTISPVENLGQHPLIVKILMLCGNLLINSCHACLCSLILETSFANHQKVGFNKPASVQSREA